MKTNYGNVSITKDGYYVISSHKEGNYGKKLHRLIWEDWYQKPVPEGYVIHHLNEDKKDARIQNLQCVSNENHTRFHHKGKTLSEETKQKISEAKKGENNPNYGKPISKETKQKISESLRCKYARVIKAGTNKNGKQVYSLNYNGQILKYSIFKDKLEKMGEEINKKKGD
jgi:hypothetical protein